MNATLALFLLSAALTVQARVLTADQEWEAFKVVHGHKFSDIEARKEKFLVAKDQVDRHNAEADQGLHTYWKQVNDFAIMTEQEMQTRMGATVPQSPSKAQIHVMTNVAAPESLDLRTSTCLPPVENQGGCGSCWAFSTVCPIEYQYCINNKLATPLLFSEQQLVDCTLDYDNYGCDGGWMYNSWNYMETNGLEKLTDYPYTSGNSGRTGNCTYDASKGVAKVASYTKIGRGSGATTAIKQALVTYGPVSVTLDASRDWQLYTTGIFDGKCTTILTHAVAIVGYGKQNGTDYWIVRNSWGLAYGDQGYWLMKAGVNQCGIEDWAMYPVVAA